ncbi:sensor histidine kinase [Paenibacillus arenilitoris]|uniref:Histidine kinase n=1 Tax=Paenibacillus arenilitoris TaxID=2772299 RepID=A0A927CF95_9BACL|nr:histidine kinase [Paenibacillus arenilitoris]MBD2866999.1 histidine kinase [Paenibacillus arenilitoris]
MRSKWNSMIVKVMISFFLVIMPLYGLSVYYTFNSSDQMRESIERTNESVLSFHFSSLQFELNRMKNLVGQFSQDEELSDFSTLLPIMNKYDISQRLNHILIKLEQMKSSSPYIKDVFYYLPALGKVVSVTNQIYDDPDEEWIGLIENRGELKGAVSEYNGNLFLLAVSPFMLGASSEPNFILAIQISVEELNRQLESLQEENMSGAFIVFGSGNHVIISDRDMLDHWSALKEQEKEGVPGQLVRTITDKEHYYSMQDSYFQFEFVSYVSNDVLYQSIRRYSGWMWVLSIASCLIVIVFSVWIYRLIHMPLVKLIRGFKTLERGNTTQEISHRRGDEFGYLYGQFNKTINRLHTLIEDNYVHRIRTQDAELKHLQSQIKPHFLYNSLFTIKQMAVMEDTEGIEEFSDYLGQYFRFVTKDSASEVTLKQEIEHSVIYLRIQQTRFSNRIKVELEPLPEAFEAIPVPRILFQPILENVFEHGLRHTAYKGLLRMTHRTEGSVLMIDVEDNGQMLTDEKLSELKSRLDVPSSLWEDRETTGLFNVHQRLRIHFGDEYGLRLDRSLLGGLKAAVHIPITRKG